MKKFKLYWFFRKIYDTCFRKKNESLIPEGIYCHGPLVQDPNNSMVRLCPNRCPYWTLNPREEEQSNGYCSFLGEGDWEPNGTSLLWDSCKECGINDNFEDEE
jgi:hypothetical protein